MKTIDCFKKAFNCFDILIKKYTKNQGMVLCFTSVQDEAS